MYNIWHRVPAFIKIYIHLKHSKQSFSISAPFFNVRADSIHLPIIGSIKCEINLPDSYKLVFITISKSHMDRYYASINYEMEMLEPKIDKSKSEIGIDFGLRNFITDSNGNITKHPLPLKKYLKQLRRANRKLARRKKISNRRREAKYKVARIHEKITFIRNDFLHQLSSRLVRENQAIYLEDLNIEGMKKRFGRSVSDSGWSEFVRQLIYKGKRYGCCINKIDRFYPSSKTCSNCNDVYQELSLGQETWTCSSCGELHQRDWNAAKNILKYGRADRNSRVGRDGLVETLAELPKQAAS